MTVAAAIYGVQVYEQMGVINESGIPADCKGQCEEEFVERQRQDRVDCCGYVLSLVDCFHSITRSSQESQSRVEVHAGKERDGHGQGDHLRVGAKELWWNHRLTAQRSIRSQFLKH